MASRQTKFQGKHVICDACNAEQKSGQPGLAHRRCPGQVGPEGENGPTILPPRPKHEPRPDGMRRGTWQG